MEKSMRERLVRLLDEASLSFRAAHGASCVEDGWLRAVRVALGVPVEELARRQGVGNREIFRLERAEKESRITLGALKRAAEAMDCEVTYGLTPKYGTLAEMAAVWTKAREKALHERRLEADERRVAEGKPRRMRDPQLAAIKELLHMAGTGSATPNPCAERLRVSVDRRVGRSAKTIARALTKKAVKGDLGSIKMLIELTGADRR
jgi:transcriptional regulator with XRE-family HTH domain